MIAATPWDLPPPAGRAQCLACDHGTLPCPDTPIQGWPGYTSCRLCGGTGWVSGAEADRQYAELGTY